MTNPTLCDHKHSCGNWFCNYCDYCKKVGGLPEGINPVSGLPSNQKVTR